MRTPSPPTPGSARPYLRADVRRRQLLDAAARLFVRDGYPGLTMVALASEAGVSRRLVYDHFPDLASLYDAFFDDRAAGYVAAIDETLTETEGDVVASFTAAFGYLLTIPADDQRAIRILVADPGLPELEGVRQRFRSLVERRWLRSFVGTRSDREFARALLWTLVHGFLGLADLVNRREISAKRATALATALVEEVPRAVMTRR